MLDRRSFVTLLGGALVAERFGSSVASAATLPTGVHRLPKVGLQLYTVRGEMEKDVAATLAHVAKIGYKELEFAGYFKHSPAELKKMIGDLGMTAPSTHVQLPATPAEWQKTMADAKELGATYVTVAWIDEKQRQSIDDFKRFAQQFNEAGDAAKKAGLKFAYHNHDFEIKPMSGQRAIDVLLADTDPNLVSFEMDIYWVVKGGGDPMALLRAHPTRFTMVHAKDATAAPARKKVSVGAGSIPFKKILSFGKRPETGMQAGSSSKHGAIEHVFVEHDNPTDPWKSIAASYKTLSAMNI